MPLMWNSIKFFDLLYSKTKVQYQIFYIFSLLDWYSKFRETRIKYLFNVQWYDKDIFDNIQSILPFTENHKTLKRGSFMP